MSYESLVPRVMHQYQLPYRAVYSVQKGYRSESYPIELTDGTLLNLIFFKREAGIVSRINFADNTAHYAARSSLPVRTRFDQRLVGAKDGNAFLAGLYWYLPGKTIPWEAFTKKHIKLLGWAMSDLHGSLKDKPIKDGRFVADELLEIIERMRRYFARPAVQEAMRQKLEVEIDRSRIATFASLLYACKTLSDVQALHMDLVRGNVLFNDAKPADRWQLGDISLTGVIDFEKAAYGHPIFDVARTLAFLKTDCPSYLQPKLVRYFVSSGYNKRGAAFLDLHANTSEASYGQLLHGLVGLFLLYDFYKFLRHTPYEALSKNHHYVRTRDVLNAYAVLRYR